MALYIILNHTWVISDTPPSSVEQHTLTPASAEKHDLQKGRPIVSAARWVCRGTYVILYLAQRCIAGAML